MPTACRPCKAKDQRSQGKQKNSREALLNRQSEQAKTCKQGTYAHRRPNTNVQGKNGEPLSNPTNKRASCKIDLLTKWMQTNLRIRAKMCFNITTVALNTFRQNKGIRKAFQNLQPALSVYSWALQCKQAWAVLNGVATIQQHKHKCRSEEELPCLKH